MLPCKHSICLSCITKLMEKGIEKKERTNVCTVCQKAIPSKISKEVKNKVVVQEYSKMAMELEQSKYVPQFLLSSISVSYTHLRAHETSLHLVCRLLLEKKKKKQLNKNITTTISALNTTSQS
eukprot:TRINITY_DN16232_c0_g1_i1.p2 TRINITY_DN16232_c0_g1~~TRINITY_DN16232_c0_g1_i1.p2  ORF type:complete len:123 (-),score=15.52 TRINITY_DN16232_c0_g1_i1:67-435(-)